jgi:hypothetical protein
MQEWLTPVLGYKLTEYKLDSSGHIGPAKETSVSRIGSQVCGRASRRVSNMQVSYTAPSPHLYSRVTSPCASVSSTDRYYDRRWRNVDIHDQLLRRPLPIITNHMNNNNNSYMYAEIVNDVIQDDTADADTNDPNQHSTTVSACLFACPSCHICSIRTPHFELYSSGDLLIFCIIQSCIQYFLVF